MSSAPNAVSGVGALAQAAGSRHVRCGRWVGQPQPSGGEGGGRPFGQSGDRGEQRVGAVAVPTGQDTGDGSIEQIVRTHSSPQVRDVPRRFQRLARNNQIQRGSAGDTGHDPDLTGTHLDQQRIVALDRLHLQGLAAVGHISPAGYLPATLRSNRALLAKRVGDDGMAQRRDPAGPACPPVLLPAPYRCDEVRKMDTKRQHQTVDLLAAPGADADIRAHPRREASCTGRAQPPQWSP